MRAAVGIALALLVVFAAPSGLAVGPARLEFSAPAQVSGNATLAGLQWVLLVFPPDEQATFSLQSASEGSATNHTYAYGGVHQDQDPGAHAPTFHEIPSNPESFAILDADLTFDGSWSSLFVEAERISFAVDDANLGVQRSDGSRKFYDYLPANDAPFRAYRYHLPLAPPGLAIPLESSEPNGTFASTLEAHGVRKVEWTNAEVACRTPYCPDGAKPAVSVQPLPGGRVWAGTISFTEIQATSGTIMGTGSAKVAAAGGSTVTASLDGWARFPKASLSGDCGGQSCEDPAGRTFQARGRVVLEDLAAVPGTRDRLQSHFQGDLASAYFDETQAPLLTTAAVGGAAAVALAVIVKILAGFFARNTRPLLEHPKAKALHDLVLGRPGISFSGLKETTSLGHGTVHYHLRRLLKAGLIVAYGYRNSVRYFENHGRHQHDWQEHAALQKPELRRLHEWIAAHPRSSQSTIIHAAAEWGWKRSTTRHYLGVLQEARLIQDDRKAPNAVEYVARRLTSPVS